jgi:hypothetical protein
VGGEMQQATEVAMGGFADITQRAEINAPDPTATW